MLNVAQMADYFGIGRTTFFSILSRDPEVSERYKRGRARAVGSIAQSLVTKARAGDTTPVIFFLKTQGGWRETLEVETREADDPGNQAFRRLASMVDLVSERMAAAKSTVPVIEHDDS